MTPMRRAHGVADDTVYREFDLYGMKVVIDDRTVTPEQMHHYIRYLDETYHRLKAKHLDRVWHGTIFIRCKECGGSNPNGADYGVGGDYPVGTDVVNLYARPSEEIVHMLSHELGHRYWFKFMHQSQRGKFESLVRVTSDPVLPSHFEERLESTRKDMAEFFDYLPRALKEIGTDLDKAEHTVPHPGGDLTVEDYIADELSHLAITESVQYVSPPNLYDISPKSVQGKIPDIAYQEAMSAREKLIEHLEALPQIPGVADYEPAVAREGLKQARKWLDEAWRLLKAYLLPVYRYIDAVSAATKRQVAPDDDRPVFPVSTYGGSNIAEAFAEVFSYYVLGEDLNRGQLESFRSVLSSMQERIVARFKSAVDCRNVQ